MLSTGTIPESLKSIHKAFTNIVPNHSLGIPISLFAGLATTSLFVLAFRDICITTDVDVTQNALSKSKSESHLKSKSKSKSKVIPSPLTTQIPTLSHEKISALPYPPDIFPGARDITSPHGSTRAYEFGPLNGPKILLVHGISTPCISLHHLATALASTHGCRVLLFDLFGRGYSDGVADLPHDERLYTAQILLVLTSSSISWAGEGFHIIGFSMGGGIAVDFAVDFPAMVRGVVLLAPGGLIREERFGWKGKVMRKWWFPDGLWGWILRRRVRGAYEEVSSSLSTSPSSSLRASDSEFKPGNHVENRAQVDSELIMAVPSSFSSPVASTDTKISFDDTPISPSLPYITVGQVMRWQTQQHRGYANAFASSIMYASISGCGEKWMGLWEARSGSVMQQESNVKREKILVVVGEWDDVVVVKELKEDLEGVVGSIGAGNVGSGVFDERVVWKVLEGAGHEFPITRGEEVAGIIGEFLEV
ncbi:hypothetical protein SBOR_0437 [Sclerotinia borealis F-4128]|uniref:Serine aminopeptidase S33 domain-containing protein n=1 Tax=Sclerotinia borealis (strain F-4128) TaxID=1432307 RepID=W9CX02_SCLBF|nr:hypothetical protein SBOR_0437 [Sclerotinia borealis F-4128]